jgi:hypothetical protein
MRATCPVYQSYDFIIQIIFWEEHKLSCSFSRNFRRSSVPSSLLDLNIFLTILFSHAIIMNGESLLWRRRWKESYDILK